MKEVEPLSQTQTFRSLPIIFAVVLIPMFVVLAVVYWILSFLASLNIAQGFAITYINTLQGIVASLDLLVPFTFGVMFAAVVVRSFLTNTNPVYGVVGLFGLPVAVIITAYVANVPAILTGFEALAPIFNEFRYTILFVQNSPTIVGIAGTIVLLVMIGGGALARR